MEYKEIGITRLDEIATCPYCAQDFQECEVVSQTYKNGNEIFYYICPDCSTVLKAFEF